MIALFALVFWLLSLTLAWGLGKHSPLRETGDPVPIGFAFAVSLACALVLSLGALTS